MLKLIILLIKKIQFFNLKIIFIKSLFNKFKFIKVVLNNF